MPWKIGTHPDCNGVAVIKESDGTLAGCHKTDDEAKDHLRALYASEEESVEKSLFIKAADSVINLFDMLVRGELPGIRRGSDVNFYTPEQLAAISDIKRPEPPAAPELKHIEPVDGETFLAGLNKQEQHKRVRGTDYPARNFAVVRNPQQPATWAILLVEGEPDNYSFKSLRRAATMLVPGTMAYKALGLSMEEVTGVKRRIRAELQKLGVAPTAWPPSVRKEVDTIDEDGRTRWFAVFSNNYIDDDYPPDILSERAHKAFVYLVKQGVISYPELWFWHLPGTRMGEADLIDYADGFVYASGYVDPGMETKVAHLSTSTEPIGVSHGMPLYSVLRNRNDPRVVDFYITTEISALPLRKAANKLTHFSVKESQMSLNKDQLDELAKLEYTPAEIAQIEEVLAQHAVVGAGRESKEQSEEAVVDAEAQTINYVTREEVLELIRTQAELMNSQAAAMAGVMQRVEGFEATLKSMNDRAAVDALQTVQATPAASLNSLFKTLVINQPEAVVDGRTTFAKEGPKETEAPKPSPTGVPFLDNLIGSGR